MSRPGRAGRAAGAEIKIGVSACVLGHEVRWNGGHKLDTFVRDTLGARVALIAVCPEAELGLGVPREAVHLVARGPAVRMVGVTSGRDHTDGMTALTKRRADQLADDDISGFVVQHGSPSCGLAGVEIHGGDGGPASGRGLFTAALLRRLPHLPVEEAGALADLGRRESFVTRVFAYRRLRELFGGGWTVGELVAFHAAEKLLLLAHDRVVQGALGRLVATARRRDPAAVAERYPALMLAGLARVATRGSHTHVLQHLAGHFKKRLDDDARRALAAAIDQYRTGQIELDVPLALLREYVRRYDLGSLAQQTYFGRFA